MLIAETGTQDTVYNRDRPSKRLRGDHGDGCVHAAEDSDDVRDGVDDRDRLNSEGGGSLSQHTDAGERADTPDDVVGLPVGVRTTSVGSGAALDGDVDVGVPPQTNPGMYSLERWVLITTDVRARAPTSDSLTSDSLTL